MALGRFLAALNDVGLTQAKIDKAVGESIVVSEAVIRKAKEVQEYWKSIAPVSDRGPHPLGKTNSGNGYIDEPGDYRDSIMVTYQRKPGGYFSAKVGTKDPKAHWLEYGSVHNLPPNIGYAQKTVDHFNGVAGGIYVSARA